MVPNSAVVLTSADWRALEQNTHPGNVWSSKTEAGQDWETFDAIAYGIDVVVPIINFGQTDAWAPSTNRGDAGKFLFWWRWVMLSAGWLVTALAAASITGIMQRK